MPDYGAIYRTRAADYDLMVSREDIYGNIAKAIQAVQPIENTVIVDFGAGTGRLTRLVAPLARYVIACDISTHMLAQARGSLPRYAPPSQWGIAVGDNRHMPLPADMADIALAGWSFGHSLTWFQEQWQDAIAAAISEMARVLRPDGVAIILETMGTGAETPMPPTESLATYYAWLENELGFAGQTFRTDYRFESLAEAERLTRFFFGDALAERVVNEGLQVLPECTGMWWRRF